MLLHGWEHQCGAALLFWLGWSNTRCRIKSSPYSWLEIQLRFSQMPRTHIALLQSLWLTHVIGSTRKHRVVLQISRGPRALYQMLKALETPGLTFSMKTVTKACKKSGRKEVRKSCWPRKNRQIFWNFVSNRNDSTFCKKTYKFCNFYFRTSETTDYDILTVSDVKFWLMVFSSIFLFQP